MRAVGDHRAQRWRKHMKALILASAAVLALGIGGVGTANAWSGHSGSTMAPSSRHMSHSGMSSMRNATGAAHHRSMMVKEAQRALRRHGLYHGNIDGVMGSRTRHALARYQRMRRLPVTASLNRETMGDLMGSRTAGFGSSMHRHATTGQGTLGQTPPPMPSETGTSGQTTGRGTIPPSGTNTGTTK